MEKMRFRSIWRLWIRGCLSSAKISVLVNGSPTPEFDMERGLKQGDPLSPFLFLIVAEAMSVMMQEASNKGLFKGCSIGSLKMELTHLQFADDSLFLGSGPCSTQMLICSNNMERHLQLVQTSISVYTWNSRVIATARTQFGAFEASTSFRGYFVNIGMGDLEGKKYGGYEREAMEWSIYCFRHSSFIAPMNL